MSAPWLTGGRAAARIVERHLAAALLSGARDAAATRAARRCERIWRRASESLGPASGGQAVWFHLVEPCAAALEWPTPPPALHDLAGLRAWAAVPSSGLDDTLLVALPWGVEPRGVHRPLLRAAVEARALWVAACNGRTWCWYDARRPYTRDHLALDLAHAATDGRVWQALWLLGQPSAPQGRRHAHTRWLDRVIADSQVDDAAAAAALRSGVDAAVAALGRVDGGTRDEHVRQVFQWLFLLCAEARALVPSWHLPYRRSYSVTQLARDGMQGRPAAGIHDGVTAIARLAREGGRIGGVDAAALNGRLFEETSVTRRGAGIADGVLGDALAQLAGLRPAHGASATPDFGDLRIEHLGAIYEHLMAPPPGAGRAAPLQRKRAGAFYTPRPLADLLVQRALGPLVDTASSDTILGLRILDPAMGSGALLASALRYLVHAVEAAWVREGRAGPLDVSRDDREQLPRRIAEQCLFGVDIDATAVQVARMSIWLLSLAPDRPLTWLDAHLRLGNSLIGTSPSTVLARAPIQGRAGRRHDGQLTLFELSQWHHDAGELGPRLAALAARPTETSADAQDKACALERLRSHEALARWRARADAWCAAAMDAASLSAGEWRMVDDGLREGRADRPGRRGGHRARWLAKAAAHRCLHWSLEFPDIFDAGRGGFDAVIANPPWEMLRGDLGSDGERAARRGDLAPLLRFVQRSGTYRRVSGHINSYQLFAERMLQLVRPGGRVGCLLPGAVLGDHGSAPLRRHLLDQMTVDRVSVVENRSRLFPIHRSMRIVAVTGTTGAATEAFVADEGPPEWRACGLRGTPDPSRRASDATELARAPACLVTRTLLRALTGGESIPSLRHPHDLRILEALTAWPSLGGTEWQLRFGRELNATEDASCLRRHPGRDGLAVIDGKHLSPFAVRRSSEGRWIAAADALARLAYRPWTHWRLAYRDVSSPTNARSLIAALLPPGTVSTHTVFCLRTPTALRTQLYLCGMLNSLVVDWYVRRFLGGHVTTRLIASVRVPRPSKADPRFRRIVRLALRLIRNPGDHEAHARLHATTATLLGLQREDLAHLSTDFPRLPPAVRAAMLAQ